MYHFITGLPRSGSTLLSSILSQNPRFHSSITDPIASLVIGTITQLGNEPGMKTEVPIDRRKNLIRGIFDGYYKDIDKPVIFNTNRGWTYNTHIMSDIYPKAKYIVCVRDINWVLDSFEVVHRKNPLAPNTVSGGPINSVYERVEKFMEQKGIVGYSYIGIKQAITGNEKHKLLLVEYDQLCKNPENIIRSIYTFINEEYFEHDFDNVENNWDSYDTEIGIKLHQVKKKVQFTERNFILPPDILQKYSNMEVWRL